MLDLCIKLVDRLVVYPENMKANIERSHGVIYSQTVLLELVRRGLTREDAYALVQSAAMKSWAEQRHLVECLRENKSVTDILSDPELSDLFEGKKSLQHVDYVFKRCGLS
jgi:adenylosuccinate lyase